METYERNPVGNVWIKCIIKLETRVISGDNFIYHGFDRFKFVNSTSFRETIILLNNPSVSKEVYYHLFPDAFEFTISIFAAYIKFESDNLNFNQIETSSIAKKIPLDSEYKDLKIRVGSSEFDVHKVVLASVSSIFRAALLNDFKEKQSNIIKISNFDADVIELMITFIYEGSLEIEDYDQCVNLLKVADFYDIENLKLLCSDFLKQYIGKKDILSILHLADVYHADTVKIDALNYFASHLKIPSDDDLEVFSKLSTNVATDMFVKLIKTAMAYEELVNSFSLKRLFS